MRRRFVPLLAALVLLGCGDSSDSSGDDDEATTTTTADPGDGGDGEGVDDVAEVPVVEVLDPGAEPRAELRYAFAAGTTARFETSTVVDQTVDESSPGPISTTIEVVTEVRSAADGEAAIRITYGTPVVTTAPEALPAVVAAAERSAAVLDGAVADVRIDGQGRVLDLDLQLADDAGELAEQLRDGLVGNLQSQGVALPSEPVGVGARWIVHTVTDASGTLLLNEQTFTLAGRDDRGVDLTFTAAGTFEEGATGSSTTTGTMRVDFDAFYPEVSSTSTNELTAQATRITQTIEQTIRRL